MSVPDVILSTPGATLRRYVRAFDQLTLELVLWDESTRSLVATGVTFLEDQGTWEVDALVRLSDLNLEGKRGYGIVNVEGAVTLRFVADNLEF
jgi:hypothetical protein